MRSTLRSSVAAAFTLIELTIVVGIIGILAAIAISNVGQFTSRTRRLEARAVLAGVSSAEMANRFATTQWACTFDELPLTIDGATRVSATELRGSVYVFQIGCDSDGNYRVTATSNIDADGWMDVAVATPVTRFAMQYDDVFDTYDPSAASVPAPTPTPVATATPAPSATNPPSATPAPTATPANGNGNGNNGNGNGNNGNNGQARK